MKERPRREDVLRWVFGLVITAVVASAATSAVFLAVRPLAQAPNPFVLQLDQSAAEMESLAPSLTRWVHEQLAAQPPNEAGVVEVRYSTGMPEQAASVPMVSVGDQRLIVGTTTPWRLDVTSTRQTQEFGRIIDIRRSNSVARPGYVGVVELKVTRRTAAGSVEGHLPFEPPDGFQVVTPARYTELEESRRYSQHVLPASAAADEIAFHYERWDPAQPPPEELPKCVQEQFHQAIVQCAAAPAHETAAAQTVTFFYCLRDGAWMPLP